MIYDVNKHRTYYSVDNYNRRDSKGLEYKLSTWDEAYFKSHDMGFHLDEKRRQLRIPSGYSEDNLFKYLQSPIQNQERKYNDFNRINIDLTAGPRDDRQKSIITFLCTMNAYSKYRGTSQLFIDLDTGDGKTYCAIASACYYKTNTLISTPSDNSKIIDQWFESITKFTTLKKRDVLIVKGGKICEDILAGKYPEKKFFIMPRSTSQAFMKKHGYDAFDELTKAMNVGCHYIDEAHKDMKTLVAMLTHTNIYRTVFITATFGRSDAKEHEIYEALFGSIPRFGSRLKQAEENHIEVQFMRYHIEPTWKERKACKTKYGLNGIRYGNWLMMQDDFWDVVDCSLNHILKFREDNGRLLILLPSIASIERMAEYLNDFYPQYTVGKYHSKIPKREKDAQLENDIVIATEKGMGTGAEFKNHQLTINFLSYSSDILGKQISGRNRKYSGRRSIYLEPINMGFPEVVNQYYKRRQALQSKSKDHEIEVFDMDIDMLYKAQQKKNEEYYYGNRGNKYTLELKEEMKQCA